MNNFNCHENTRVRWSCFRVVSLAWKQNLPGWLCVRRCISKIIIRSYKYIYVYIHTYTCIYVYNNYLPKYIIYMKQVFVKSVVGSDRFFFCHFKCVYLTEYSKAVKLIAIVNALSSLYHRIKRKILSISCVLFCTLCHRYSIYVRIRTREAYYKLVFLLIYRTLISTIFSAPITDGRSNVKIVKSISRVNCQIIQYLWRWNRFESILWLYNLTLKLVDESRYTDWTRVQK